MKCFPEVDTVMLKGLFRREQERCTQQIEKSSRVDQSCHDKHREPTLELAIRILKTYHQLITREKVSVMPQEYSRPSILPKPQVMGQRSVTYKLLYIHCLGDDESISMCTRPLDQDLLNLPPAEYIKEINFILKPDNKPKKQKS